MAQRLGDMAVGSIVKLNENGIAQDYIIVHQGVPDATKYKGDATGTWILKKDVHNKSFNINTCKYIGSNFDNYLNTEWGDVYDKDILPWFKSVGIPVHPGTSGSSCKTTFAYRKFFIPSYAEVGGTVKEPGYSNSYSVDDGATLAYFLPIYQSDDPYGKQPLRIANYDDLPRQWFTRTASSQGDYSYLVVYDTGGMGNVHPGGGYVRHLSVLDSDRLVNDSGFITATKYFFVSLITTPDIIMQGQPVPLSWAEADGATTYILERNVDSGGWVQIYSGSDLSFTDTAGSWATVQYRVKAGAGADFGDYTTSPAIPVVSANALVISGTDSDLGTVTADIPYTVVTDTSNPITLTRKVNGQLVATTTVQNGFSYSIPVLDLPTGSGTIEITASVNTSGGSPVTATRTWTYTKLPVTFPDTGGPAQLAQGGQNVFPPTLAEAVRVPAHWGGSLDKALEMLLSVVNAAVISVGTYEGTGTFGADNPSTLTFSQEPVVVTIYGGGQTLVISSTDTGSTAYLDGKTAKWYGDSAAAQMNTDGTIYRYVAVGKQV